MNVEQIDLFAAIEEIEKAQYQKKQPRAVIRKVEASAKEIEKLGTEDMIPPSAPTDWLYVLTWPWNFFTSLFGLGVWVNVYMADAKTAAGTTCIMTAYSRKLLAFGRLKRSNGN
ncbi:hypothetical protein [Paenibacillus sp. MMO-58]|uniref:hypothetical protein n=1 Tax=Paenibacillus sp. MMO-58 TaxID=3081290 RepID=UPI0030174EB0